MLKFKKFHSLFLGFVFPVLLLIAPTIKAQLVTSTALTPTQLVQTVLLGGGLTATNITYNGDATAIGSFIGSSSNIGFAGGIIMASGDIANAIGPNGSGGQTTGFFTTSSDPDLSAIATAPLNDAAILEFDFVPSSDTVKFRYVFGSEEYPEYVCSDYNDVFGFFISGPNPAGGSYSNQNIALVPGASLAVAINSVNPGVPGMFANGGTCTSLAYSSLYFDNEAPPGTTIEYDGFTIPLTAIAPVICGSTYHIKIAIADAGDGSYDSGVFLEAGSFASAGGTTLTSSTNFGGTIIGNDSTIYEGCGFASLLVNRPESTAAQAFFYSVTGTAINGDDYSVIGDTVYFVVGQDSAHIIINSLPDLLIEGTETAIITLYSASSCNGSDTLSKTIYIIDTPPLKVSLNDDTTLVCPAQGLFLTANTAGGVAVGGFTYTWVNASGSGGWSNVVGTVDTVHINPLSTTTYIVTVSDSCGNTASDTATFNYSAYVPMQVALNNDTIICGGEQVLLDADVINGLPGYTYLWTPTISTQDSVTVFPPTSAVYILQITDLCGYSKTDTVNVTVYPISSDFQPVFTTNQTATFNDLSVGAVTYIWNFGDASDDSTSTLANPEHFYANDGTYTVMLISTNPNGCSDTSFKTVEVLPDFYFYFPDAFTPNVNGNNDLFRGYGAGIKTYRMRIFDRWGKFIFESSDITIGWDGTYKGDKVMSDVFTCVFDVESMRGIKKRKIGRVTLLR
ncbi:MAG: choice-of-anchor L domain-containing protein [Bacteroidetes bacterium]|nr:choice-of-anchor L domain-containing protein [Bacteroidota bacterium]